MKSIRSTFTAIALAVGLLAYVPVCCCWTETVAAWMAGDAARACGHVCCGHHGGTGGASHHEDHPTGDDHGPRVPGRLAECMCGVQHRIVSGPALTVLDFEPAVVGYVPARLFVACDGAGEAVVLARGAVGWAADPGAGSLLRLHCALTV